MSEILTEVEVDYLAAIVEEIGTTADPFDAAGRNFLRLIVSHRLLSARVKELEEEREFWQDRARGYPSRSSRNMGGT